MFSIESIAGQLTFRFLSFFLLKDMITVAGMAMATKEVSSRSSDHSRRLLLLKAFLCDWAASVSEPLKYTWCKSLPVFDLHYTCRSCYMS